MLKKIFELDTSICTNINVFTCLSPNHFTHPVQPILSFEEGKLLLPMSPFSAAQMNTSSM